MMKLTVMTMTIALAINIIPSHANETETKLQNMLKGRIEQLSCGVQKYEKMNQALQRMNPEDRADALRVVCRRMKRDTAAVAKTIDYLDLYHELNQFNHHDAIELGRTKKNIRNIKNEIYRLKSELSPTVIATK